MAKLTTQYTQQKKLIVERTDDLSDVTKQLESKRVEWERLNADLESYKSNHATISVERQNLVANVAELNSQVETVCAEVYVMEAKSSAIWLGAYK